MAKETYIHGKRELHTWQERPTYMAKETYIHGKRNPRHASSSSSYCVGAPLSLKQTCVRVSYHSAHMCRVIEHGAQQGRMFQAVEWLPGKSLSEALKSNKGHMSEADTLGLTMELLLGLEAVHAGGLSHWSRV